MSSDVFPFQIGHHRCYAIRDGEDFDRNILLLKTGGHQILIDTGLGPDWEPMPGQLCSRLTAADSSPAAIDLVILSHADWDHIAGAVLKSGQLAFPNAKYVLARAEWDFWAAHPERLSLNETFDDDFRQLARGLPLDRLARLHGHLALVDFGTELVPGLRLIGAPGHTPGYAVIALTGSDEQLLSIGDVITSDTDGLQDPNWHSVFDYDRDQGSATRRKILEEAAQHHTLLMGHHVTFPGLGYVSPLGPGWQWQTRPTSDR